MPAVARVCPSPSGSPSGPRKRSSTKPSAHGPPSLPHLDLSSLSFDLRFDSNISFSTFTEEPYVNSTAITEDATSPMSAMSTPANSHKSSTSSYFSVPPRMSLECHTPSLLGTSVSTVTTGTSCSISTEQDSFNGISAHESSIPNLPIFGSTNKNRARFADHDTGRVSSTVRNASDAFSLASTDPQWPVAEFRGVKSSNSGSPGSDRAEAKRSCSRFIETGLFEDSQMSLLLLGSNCTDAVDTERATSHTNGEAGNGDDSRLSTLAVCVDPGFPDLCKSPQSNSTTPTQDALKGNMVSCELQRVKGDRTRKRGSVVSLLKTVSKALDDISRFERSG